MTSSQFKKHFPVGTKFNLTYHWRKPEICGPREVVIVQKPNGNDEVIFDNGSFLTLKNVEFTPNGFVAKLLIKGKMETALIYELNRTESGLTT